MTEETTNDIEQSETKTPLSPEEQKALQDKINKLRGITPDDSRPKKKKKKPTNPDDPDDDDDDDDDPEGTGGVDDDDEDGESDENEKEDESKDLKVQRDPFEHLKQRTSLPPKKQILLPKEKNLPRGLFQQMFDMLLYGKDGVAIRDGKISTKPRIFDQILFGLGMTIIKKDIELQQQAAEYWRQKRSGITPNKNLLRTDLTPAERASLMRGSPFTQTKTAPSLAPIRSQSNVRVEPQQERVATRLAENRTATPAQEGSVRATEKQTTVQPTTKESVRDTTPPATDKKQNTKAKPETTEKSDFDKKNDAYYQQSLRTNSIRERAAQMLRELGLLSGSPMFADGLIPRISANSEHRITHRNRPSRLREDIYDRPMAPDIINVRAEQRDRITRQEVQDINRAIQRPGQPGNGNAPEEGRNPAGNPSDGTAPNSLHDAGTQLPQNQPQQPAQPQPAPIDRGPQH